MPVDLGFVEKCEGWRLESRFFPSKVGGRPAWLNLKDIPGEKDLRCEYCQDPCIFLCQIYAPYEDNETAFHRTIYVFVCKKSECCKLNESGNLKVFRSQLPRTNEFYSPEPPVEEPDWRIDVNTTKWVKTCQLCGIYAPNHCSKCKQVNYCCRIHQIFDWKSGHKESCCATTNSKLLFPEYEIIIEAEDEKEDNNEIHLETEKQEITKYENMLEKGEAGTFQNEDVQSELLSMANQTEDEIFAEFRSTIDKYPDQILRYDRGGKILYISGENKIDEIPKCLECHQQRQFEFQRGPENDYMNTRSESVIKATFPESFSNAVKSMKIMPQLLNFLNLEDTLKCIDWGILAIFTCTNSCTSTSGYSTEYAWKQDIVETNLD